MDPSNSQLSFAEGTVFGPYRVLSELARGGQGLVLRAQHAEGTVVALKVLLQAQGLAYKRFQQEVAVLARLFHPNLPRILDTGNVGGRPYLAMQLVEGLSLSQRLKLHGPLPIDEAIEILGPVAQALEYCHSFGVFHRDLKPGNIVVDEQTRRPFLVDFGILKHDSSDGALSLDGASRMSLTGEVVGTISYMAPEQSGDSDVPVSAATDVYGLSATLYDMLTGRPPFKGETAFNTLLAVIDKDPEDPRKLRPEIPAGVALAILKGLSKDPQSRPASPLLLLAALRAGLLPPLASATSRRPAWPLVLAGVVLLGLLGFAGWVLGGTSAGVSPTASPSATASALPPRPSPPQGAPPTPSPAALPPVQRPRGQPGSLSLRLESISKPASLVRCGPWVLGKSMDQAYGFREGDIEGGMVQLPRHAWPFGWDAEAACLVFERKGKSYRVTPQGEAPSPYPTGFGLVELAGLRVATSESGRLTAFQASAPEPPAWTYELGPTYSLPLPLDLDRDGVDDHLLACTPEGRAYLINAGGELKATLQLPSGVAHAPQVLSDAGGAPTVLVACSSGVLVRLEASHRRLTEVSRVDLLEPLLGPPVLIRAGRARPLHGVAVCVQHAGLTLVDPTLSEVKWVGRRAQRGALSLSGPLVVDVDRNGVPELAQARFSMGPQGLAWVELYHPDGKWIGRLEAGAKDLRLPAGVATRLLAIGKRGLFCWGPWESLPEPEPEDGPSPEDRVYANLLGGAWEAVEADGRKFGGIQGEVLTKLASYQLGKEDLRETITKPDLDLTLRPVVAAHGPTISPWIWHRLLAPPGHPRPPPEQTQPLPFDTGPREPDRLGVVFRNKEQPKTHGVTNLGAARFDPKRRTLSRGGRIAFSFLVALPTDFRVALDAKVFSVKGTGYAELLITLDGKAVGSLSHYYGSDPQLSLSLGALSPGSHRLHIEVRRSTALVAIRQIWAEVVR